MPIVRKLDTATIAHLDAQDQAAAHQWQQAMLTLRAELADGTGISRIDSKGTHGWFARVYPPGQAVCARQFSDGQYGSPAAALAAAVAWRDAERQRLQLGPPAKGLHRIWYSPSHRGHIASLAGTPTRQRRQRLFSDSRHGGREGSQRAAALWIREHEG